MPSALDPAFISVERGEFPETWDWPEASPLRLRLPDATGAALTLVPYGAKEQGERKNEAAYARPLCMLLAAQGFRYDPEVTQAQGRSDLIAEHPCGIYIFELKVDESPDEGLKQICEKGCAEPYRARGLPIYAFGLSFDSKTRQFVEGKVEKVQ